MLERLVETMEIFIFLIVMLLILLVIHIKKRSKAITKPEHFIKQALEWEAKKEYKMALEVRKEGLELNNIPPLLQGELLIGIAWIYIEWGDLQRATEFSDQTFEVVKNEKFPYDLQYEKIVQVYIQAGRSEDAKRLLNHLISRQSYDKRFLKLEKLKSTLFL